MILSQTVSLIFRHIFIIFLTMFILFMLITLCFPISLIMVPVFAAGSAAGHVSSLQVSWIGISEKSDVILTISEFQDSMRGKKLGLRVYWVRIRDGQKKGDENGKESSPHGIMVGPSMLHAGQIWHVGIFDTTAGNLWLGIISLLVGTWGPPSHMVMGLNSGWSGYFNLI